MFSYKGYFTPMVSGEDIYRYI